MPYAKEMTLLKSPRSQTLMSEKWPIFSKIVLEGGGGSQILTRESRLVTMVLVKEINSKRVENLVSVATCCSLLEGHPVPPAGVVPSLLWCLSELNLS